MLKHYSRFCNYLYTRIVMRTSNAEALKAVRQLKGGANFAATYTPRGSKSICRPMLFHNGISRAEVRQLSKSQSRVHFRGKLFEIKTARCGGKLADVLP